MSEAEAPRSEPGLYLHVPFCSTICPYCDFAVATGDAERRQRFVDSLLAEITLWAGEPWRFDTIHLGGGTPSILDPEQLARIFDALRATFTLADETLVSLEANPEDVTRERLAAWRELGVGTVSLGVQSFDAEALRFLGRRHSPEDSRRCVELAKEADLQTVSLDLIYGLPGQSPEAWRADLETAVSLRPDHLSCYQLTVHDETPFGVRRRRGDLVELPDESQAELFLATHRFLADSGYAGYEVSNFATAPEHRSRHNAKYWDHTAYLGLGPSSHSFSGGRRWWNERKLAHWQAKIAAAERPVAGSEELTREDLALERLMLALRTYEGLNLAHFAERYGFDLRKANAAQLEKWAERGLASLAAGRLIPTVEGLAVADYLARSLELE